MNANEISRNCPRLAARNDTMHIQCRLTLFVICAFLILPVQCAWKEKREDHAKRDHDIHVWEKRDGINKAPKWEEPLNLDGKGKHRQRIKEELIKLRAARKLQEDIRRELEDEAVAAEKKKRQKERMKAERRKERMNERKAPKEEGGVEDFMLRIEPENDVELQNAEQERLERLLQNEEPEIPNLAEEEPPSRNEEEQDYHQTPFLADEFPPSPKEENIFPAEEEDYKLVLPPVIDRAPKVFRENIEELNNQEYNQELSNRELNNQDYEEAHQSERVDEPLNEEPTPFLYERKSPATPLIKSSPQSTQYLLYRTSSSYSDIRTSFEKAALIAKWLDRILVAEPFGETQTPFSTLFDVSLLSTSLHIDIIDRIDLDLSYEIEEADVNLESRGVPWTKQTFLRTLEPYWHTKLLDVKHLSLVAFTGAEQERDEIRGLLQHSKDIQSAAIRFLRNHGIEVDRRGEPLLPFMCYQWKSMGEDSCEGGRKCMCARTVGEIADQILELEFYNATSEELGMPLPVFLSFDRSQVPQREEQLIHKYISGAVTYYPDESAKKLQWRIGKYFQLVVNFEICARSDFFVGNSRSGLASILAYVRWQQHGKPFLSTYSPCGNWEVCPVDPSLPVSTKFINFPCHFDDPSSLRPEEDVRGDFLQ